MSEALNEVKFSSAAPRLYSNSSRRIRREHRVSTNAYPSLRDFRAVAYANSQQQKEGKSLSEAFPLELISIKTLRITVLS